LGSLAAITLMIILIYVLMNQNWFRWSLYYGLWTSLWVW